jgi:putative membrane protein
MAIVRWTVGILVFAALLFLSLQNSELVTVRFYNWFSWEAPLIIQLLLVFAIGLVAGLLTGLLSTAKVKRQLTRLRNEHRQGAAAQRYPGDGS